MRSGERKKSPEGAPTNLKGRSGRAIGQASLSAKQNQLLERHHQKRLQAKASQEVSNEPLADLLLSYQTASNIGEKVDALNELAGRDDPEAFKLLMQAASQGDAQEQVAALDALAESPRAEHLPAVQSAMLSQDLDVRLSGLSLLSQIHSESALPLWTAVLNHPSAEVVQYGLEQVAELPARLQVPIAQQALTRNQPWMTEQSLNLLGGITSKPAVEALIPFIEHPTSGDLAQSGLFFLLSEQFDTVEQATQWWQQNGETLGPDLQPKESN
jgi:HEAT repeat protein